MKLFVAPCVLAMVWPTALSFTSRLPRSKARASPRMAVWETNTANTITRQICDSACLGNKIAGPAVEAIGGFVPEEWKQTEGALYMAAHPMAANSLAIGGSLLFFLTLANIFSPPKTYEEQIQSREQLITYLKRPIWEYTGDESFNVFLVVFHGYCFYDAFTRGDFVGFSIFAFLPQLATCVLIQIFAQLRGKQRGINIYESKGQASWKTYEGGNGVTGKRAMTGLNKLKSNLGIEV